MSLPNRLPKLPPRPEPLPAKEPTPKKAPGPRGGRRDGAGRNPVGTVPKRVFLPPSLIADIEKETAKRKAKGKKPVPNFSSVLVERCGRMAAKQK
jgi:hypothetical protein